MEIKIGLIGAGVVGSGVLEILNAQSKIIENRTGVRIVVKKVCVRDPSKAKVLSIDPNLIVSSYSDIISDEEIHTVIELIGGYEPARTIILEALRNKKNVVTANKAVLAKYGKEIFEEAQKNNVRVNYEASVCGGMPIIRTLRESFASDNIQAIYGIINGTTNYILTKMEEGLGYAEALKKAQELGFAEANPEFDVEGYDASQKLVILSRIAYGFYLPEDIPVFGISKLKLADLKYANKLGYTVKLLGISKIYDNQVEIRVQPTLIPMNHELAEIRNEVNAVYLIGEQTKETMLVGRGAGKLPTASAIVADIIDIARERYNQADFSKKVSIKSEDDVESRFYIRIMMQEAPGVLAKVAEILGKNKISINGVLQNEEDAEIIPGIITTHKAKQKDIKNALHEIGKLDVVKEKPIYMMIEDFNGK